MPAKKKAAGKSPPPRRRAPRRESPRRESPRRESPRRERAAAGGEPPPVSPFVPGMSAQCLVCPICMSLYALQQSRPEAMEHLMAAGHELFLAFRALVESQADRWEQVNTLQRISVR
jgi:hypothetical protein